MNVKRNAGEKHLRKASHQFLEHGGAVFLRREHVAFHVDAREPLLQSLRMFSSGRRQTLDTRARKTDVGLANSTTWGTAILTAAAERGGSSARRPNVARSLASGLTDVMPSMGSAPKEVTATKSKLWVFSPSPFFSKKLSRYPFCKNT
mmetsp:Transcript_5346/g.10979  ORF Transcript_5346/g.10979 Transcript_5346/m.10979 type:complete len:148 (+) Transcript_5346:440-883(+)